MTDLLLKATPEIISKMKSGTTPIANNSKEFQKLIQEDPFVEQLGDSVGINPALQNIDVEQMGDSANINPGNELGLHSIYCIFICAYLMIALFETDFFLSATLSESMKISDNQSKVSSRILQKPQSSELQTPEISMEQSKSKSTQNNLG